MAVGDAGLEARGVTRPQHSRATVLDQCDLALEHIDELVLVLVPVTQRRGCAWLEPREVDAELGQPGNVAQSRLLPPFGDGAPRRGIDPFGPHRGPGDVDLG